MPKLVAIDNKNHRELSINPANAEQHGAALNLLPVILSEFVNLAVQYPIVLTKNGDTGQFVCSIMLGFKKGENLFWQNGQWQGLYVPLQIQRQPFFVGEDHADASDSNISDIHTNNKQYLVCVDIDSPTIVKNNDYANSERLFTNDGSDTEYFQMAKSRLSELLQGEAVKTDFILQLQQFDLIQPLSLEISFINHEKCRLNGLYTIDQSKLASLETDAVVALHQAGYLSAIYTMVASLGQIYALIDKKNKLLAS